MTRYVRIWKFAELSGLTVKSVERKIATGSWLENHEYRHGPDGNIYVDIQGYEAWVEAGLSGRVLTSGATASACASRTKADAA